MADIIIRDFLKRAEKAKDDLQLQAALTAEFAVAARAEPEQLTLRAALDAAALLHWFDAGLLEKLLEVSAEEARKRLAALKDLPFVEHYRRGTMNFITSMELHGSAGGGKWLARTKIVSAPCRSVRRIASQKI
jgi:hypothetical protein